MTGKMDYFQHDVLTEFNESIKIASSAHL